MYNILNTVEYPSKTKQIKKWKDKLNINLQITKNGKKSINPLSNAHKRLKLRCFQYRLTKKIYKIDNDKCTFCELEHGSLTHLFC